MTYLDLINFVLVRLREEQVTQQKFSSDPFYRMIGASVNDAKTTVENSWKWSQNRGTIDLQIIQGQSELTLPNSVDNNYEVFSILCLEKANYLQWSPSPWMNQKYSNEANAPVQENNPGWYSWMLDDPANGNRRLKLLQPSNGSYTLRVYFHKRQDILTAELDRLLIPAHPVYTLAVALSARERGEVGGQPTGELFEVAHTALSDAIAYDSAQFPEEMDWWAMDRAPQTNVKSR